MIRSSPPSQPANDAFIALASFLVLAFLLPLTLVRWEYARFGETSLWIAYAVVLYASGRLALLIGRGRPEWLHGGFWVFVYIFIGLALLAQIAAHDFPGPFDYPDHLLTKTVLSFLIGLVGYDLGRFLGQRRQMLRTSKTRMVSLPRTIALGLIGLAFVGLAVSRYGLGTFFSSRDAVEEALQGRPAGITADLIKNEDKAVGQLMQNAVRKPVFIALYMILVFRSVRRHKLLRSTNQLALGLFIGILVVANIVVNNPIGNDRLGAGVTVLAFLSVFVDLKRRRVFRLGVVAMVVMFLFAFGALDAFRRTQERDFSRGGAVSELLISHMDYGTTQVGHETTVYVALNGHTMGRQMLGVAGLWVPRRVWPEKPIPTGTLTSRAFVNVSSSLWTEGYIDFGYLGSGMLLMFYGWGSRRLDDLYLKSRLGAVTILMPLLVGYQFIVVRGSLIPALGAWLFVLVCACACLQKQPQAVDGFGDQIGSKSLLIDRVSR